MSYMARAKEIESEIIAHRRCIHENPEVGMDTQDTVAYIKEQLTQMGYHPKQVGKGGVSATVGSGGKTILLRGDIDALPMGEDSGLPFASKKKEMAHTCGHDMHAAMLLGAAKLLKERESQLKGTVKLMFQPGEEIFAGAQDMIDHGIMEAPKVERALALHVLSGLPTGKVFVKEGPLLASCNGFKITITGKGCHGAMPQNGVDPINIGVHIHLALQGLVSREIDFSNGALLTIGEFTAGSASNIIPNTAFMQGTLRTFNEAQREFLVDRLKTIVTQTAELFRGSAEIEIFSDVPVTSNNVDFTRTIRGYLEKSAGSDYDVVDGMSATASEDFSRIANLVPAAMLFLGASDLTSGEEIFPMHHPKVVFDEAVLAKGASIYAEVAERWLEE